MPYYLGDYYRGDYYRGDPGFFGNLLKGIGGLAGRLFGATPLGAVVRGVGSFAGGQLPAPTRPGQGIGLPGPYRVSPTRILPGGQPFITKEGGACGQAGMHLNKSRVYARAGAEKGTYCVKNRSMNPANPRALRRAVRREQAFVSLAKRVLRGTGITIGRRSFASKRRGFGRK